MILILFAQFGPSLVTLNASALDQYISKDNVYDSMIDVEYDLILKWRIWCYIDHLAPFPILNPHCCLFLDRSRFFSATQTLVWFDRFELEKVGRHYSISVLPLVQCVFSQNTNQLHPQNTNWYQSGTQVAFYFIAIYYIPNIYYYPQLGSHPRDTRRNQNRQNTAKHSKTPNVQTKRGREGRRRRRRRQDRCREKDEDGRIRRREIRKKRGRTTRSFEQ